VRSRRLRLRNQKLTVPDSWTEYPWYAARLANSLKNLTPTLLQRQRLLDFTCGHVGVFAVLEKAGALVLAHEFDEGRGIRITVAKPTT
jgi:hypothetical protein